VLARDGVCIVNTENSDAECESPELSAPCVLVKRASDHCKGTMEIDSTGIIAFDGAKCEYGALECRGSRQGCNPVGA